MRKSAKTLRKLVNEISICENQCEDKSMMRNDAHTKIKPKGFPSGTPLVFLLHCAPRVLRSVLSGPRLVVSKPMPDMFQVCQKTTLRVSHNDQRREQAVEASLMTLATDLLA